MAIDARHPGRDLSRDGDRGYVTKVYRRVGGSPDDNVGQVLRTIDECIDAQVVVPSTAFESAGWRRHVVAGEGALNLRQRESVAGHPVRVDGDLDFLLLTSDQRDL